MGKTLLIAGLWLVCSSICEAQLFRRTRWSNSAPVKIWDTVSQNGHWGFPGRIQDHLAGFHGQDVSGLSREQMLDLHDAIHEGRSIPKRRAPTPAPTPAPVQAQPAVPLRIPEIVKKESYPSV
jgi:hypothetical protein